MSLNVGHIIELIVREDHVGISDLSRKLQVSRRTIYNWFNQESLSLDIICKIGNAIKHDFSKDFPEEFAKLKMENELNESLFMSADFNLDGSYSDSVSYWMNKYIRLLEKYNELLREFPSSAIREK